MSEQQQIDNGGPAFPLNWDKQGEFWAFGMTLRDYFAAKCMQGLSALPADFDNDRDTLELVAKIAYEQADAMLKERDK